MSQLFAPGGQSIKASASASVLPLNIQDLFILGLTGLIFVQAKGLSKVFSNTNSKPSILRCSAFFIPTLTSIHDYWENHHFDYTDLCLQSAVSAF